MSRMRQRCECVEPDGPSKYISFESQQRTVLPDKAGRFFMIVLFRRQGNKNRKICKDLLVF